MYTAHNSAGMHEWFDVHVAEIQSVHGCAFEPHDAFDLRLHAFELHCAHQLFSILNVFFSQQCHLYAGNLNSEMPGDSKNVCLISGDVLGYVHLCGSKL